MSRLNRWLSVSLATRKAALLCSILLTALGLAAAAPARAQGCAYVTGGRLSFCSLDKSVDFGQQITTHVHKAVFLCLHVSLSDGQVVDATVTDRTTYSAGTGAGPLSPFQLVALYGPVAADANKQFPLYAIYHDPCKNVNWTFTVSLHVIP
jgi:hypothetical protein